MAPQRGIFVCLLAVAVGCCLIHQCHSELSKDEKEQMLSNAKSCAEDVKLPPSEMTAMMNDHTMPTSQEGKCFMKCMAEKMDTMKSTGEINTVGCEAVLKDLDLPDEGTREKMIKAVEECKAAEIIDSDACETAVKNIECMQTKFTEAGITGNMMTMN